MKSSPSPNDKRRLFRQLMTARQLMVLPGVFDGYSTRLVEQAGFRAAFITGSGISEAVMGWADLGIMGYRENLDACRHMAACTTMALMGDADTGYGNAVNVYFTVRGFEDAGLAGVMIEDQVWPKRCGHMKGKEVISLAEGTEKIRAAAEARRDPDFVIKSRTDTLATHGIDEVIKRLNHYARGRCRSPVRRCASQPGRHLHRREERSEAVVRQHGLRHPQALHHPARLAAGFAGPGCGCGDLSAASHFVRDPGHEERPGGAQRQHVDRQRDRTARSCRFVRRAQFVGGVR